MFLSASSSARDNVVLPAPDGEDRTRRSPLRATCGWLCISLFNVLNLFAHLIDDYFQLEPRFRNLRVVGFRT